MPLTPLRPHPCPRPGCSSTCGHWPGHHGTPPAVLCLHSHKLPTPRPALLQTSLIGPVVTASPRARRFPAALMICVAWFVLCWTQGHLGAGLSFPQASLEVCGPALGSCAGSTQPPGNRVFISMAPQTGWVTLGDRAQAALWGGMARGGWAGPCRSGALTGTWPLDVRGRALQSLPLCRPWSTWARLRVTGTHAGCELDLRSNAGIRNRLSVSNF